MNVRILLTVVFLFTIGARGQAVRPDIVLKQRNERLVKYFPYSSVQVIDNRLDTTKIYTEETGYYPLQGVTFTEPAAEAIKKYIDASIQNSDKGTGKLLIRIEQLNITNIVNRPKFNKRSGVITMQPVRRFLQFQVTAYTNEQGHYNRLLTIKRELGYTAYEYIGHDVRRLLNDCIRVLAWSGPGKGSDSRQEPSGIRDLLKDTASYQFAKGENNIPFEQINVNIRNTWKDYPVIKENNLPAGTGVYYLFDDFTYNRMAPAPVHLVYNEKDSLYHLTGKEPLIYRKPHWGVFDGTNWYVNLSDSSYCKLTRQGDTFVFYIPASMPDMYALLSMQAKYVEDGTGTSSINTGNIISSLVATLINAALQQSITNGANRSMVRRITEEGLKHNYRYCTLNMDNGDIIYNDH